MEKQRERLIELMNKQFIELHKDGDWDFVEMLGGVADYLIKNGVIVLPCRVGDMVYKPIITDDTHKPAIWDIAISQISIEKGKLQNEAYENVYKDIEEENNPSVSEADSSLCTKEPFVEVENEEVD